MSEFDLIDVNIIDEELLIIEAEKLLSEAGDNLTKRGNALNDVCMQLYDLKDAVKIDLYVTELAKKFGFTKKMFQEKLKAIKESKAKVDMEIPPEDLPDGIDDKMAKKLGFFAHKSKYYFITKDGLFKASNFIVKPLFHIYSKSDNKRLIEIENEHGAKRIIDVQSKNLTSVDMFQQVIYNEGHYIFFGTKVHFVKILDSISGNFPIANELKTLGWQREGFYAFSNGIYNGSWQPVDEFGITTHKKTMYFSPAFSIVYNDVREDDDEYENDRYFIYQKSDIMFSQWAKLMFSVYGEKANIAIAFLISSVFRDIIYEKYKIFPHLFLFGEKQSGKSQLAWSLSNVFFNNLPAFNLNSGTQVGFFRRLGRVKNSICWFDEYTNDIDEKRFQALKSAYDGMGHEKGKMSKDNRTETTKVNSSCVISGQYLPTRDDNALFSRSILLSFERKKYTEEEMKLYDQLKKLELNGLSGILEDILKFRKDVDVAYGMTFSSILEQLKDEMLFEKLPFDERLLRNFVSILAPIKIILNTTDPIDFPFSWEQIYLQSKQAISDLSRQISSSESVANFWSMVEYMLDQHLIQNGVDFKIETCDKVLKVYDKNDKFVDRSFKDDPAKLLFIRFTQVHPIYLETHRKQFGKNGVDMVSILHYFKQHPGYVGRIEHKRFNNMVSSAYVFRYDDLKINLERISETDLNDEKDDDNGLPF